MRFFYKICIDTTICCCDGQTSCSCIIHIHTAANGKSFFDATRHLAQDKPNVYLKLIFNFIQR